MEFTPTQIFVVTVSFAVAFLLALLWYYRDKSEESSEANFESFSVLMSVFFWGVAFTFLLKMGLDLVAYYAPDAYGSQWFFIVSLFFEELAKIAALLMGVELAGKLFNELSDGVVYTVFAALGFLFFENIFYLVPHATDWQSFLTALAGRNIFTFAMHLFTVIFGMFYAIAYLRSKHRAEVHRVRPGQIGKQIQILTRQFGWAFIPWIPFAPFVTIWKFFYKGLKKISIPEVLWSGFLLSSYLHIGYDLLLRLQVPVVNGIVFFLVILFLLLLYTYFSKLDVVIE